MVTTKLARLACLLVSCAALAGCVGTNGGTPAGGGGTTGGGTTGGGTTGGGTTGGGTTGGGTTGGGSLTAYESAFNTAVGQAPTTTALTGTASYTGQVKLLTNPNVNQTDAVVGDLAMTINFDAGANPITATAQNFQGTINGSTGTVTGSVSTANGTGGLNVVAATTVPVPVIGSITSTSINVGMEGQLTDPSGLFNGNALVTLQGPFSGTNGASVSGAAGAIITSTAATPVSGGTFYANRQ